MQPLSNNASTLASCRQEETLPTFEEKKPHKIKPLQKKHYMYDGRLKWDTNSTTRVNHHGNIMAIRKTKDFNERQKPITSVLHHNGASIQRQYQKKIFCNLSIWHSMTTTTAVVGWQWRQWTVCILTFEIWASDGNAHRIFFLAKNGNLCILLNDAIINW